MNKKDLKEIKKIMNWIKITEQLPPDYEPVLFVDSRESDRNKIKIGYFVPSQTTIDNYITHWMPVPELPSQEEE